MHNTTPPVIYRAAVIGAGPAGLACLGNLLDSLATTSPTDQILWIDPQFQAGRLDSYPAVPSNTKVCLFTKYARECQSFEAEKCSKTFKELVGRFDPQRGCELKMAAELCKELTNHLLKHPRVHSVKGLVKELEYSASVSGGNNSSWTIKTETLSFQSNLVFLATGSKPKSLPLNHPTIFLDDALNPALLNDQVSPNDTVAVYGSSHSAMLVVKNLLDIPNSPKQIVNYYRQPAKFAEFPDPINCPDRILHDNTGLKGETAEWVRSWIDLSPGELEEKFQGKLKRIKTGEEESQDTEKINFDIYAVGYERNILPKIIYANAQSADTIIDYTPSGQLTLPNNNVICNGLYGFGIAFPERVKDLDGSDEAAVGLWKFMRHIKKCVSAIIQ